MSTESTDTRQLSVDVLLAQAVEEGASDLHITAGLPPQMRLNGDLKKMGGYPKLGPEDTETLIYRIIGSRLQSTLEEDRQVDFSYALPGVARFRVNTYYQRQSLAAAFRVIPDEIVPMEELGLPKSIASFAKLPRGLVLVTGATGSGKSTTLASLIDLINRTRPDHIITIEDPVEFVHTHRTSMINQREVGTDAAGFSEALRGALRQDPDVILLGEMRDLETIAIALTAAETGHLVFGTLHTQDAPSSVDRLIDVFPAAQQSQIRTQIAGTLRGVVSQTLLPRLDHQGRVAAVEVMIPDSAVSNLIRQAKLEQVYSLIQTGSNKGMQTLEQSLSDLVNRRIIRPEDAFGATTRHDELKGLLKDGGAPSAPTTTTGGGASARLRTTGRS